MERRRGVDCCWRADGPLPGFAKCGTCCRRRAPGPHSDKQWRLHRDRRNDQIDVGVGKQRRGCVEVDAVLPTSFSIHCSFASMSLVEGVGNLLVGEQIEVHVSGNFGGKPIESGILRRCNLTKLPAVIRAQLPRFCAEFGCADALDPRHIRCADQGTHQIPIVNLACIVLPPLPKTRIGFACAFGAVRISLDKAIRCAGRGKHVKKSKTEKIRSGSQLESYKEPPKCLLAHPC